VQAATNLVQSRFLGSGEYIEGRHRERRLGRADDDCFADGNTVLSFADALKIALTEERPTTVRVSHAYTLNEALDEYFSHRDARSTPTSVQSDRFAAARNIRPRIGACPIASLRTEDLLRWRDAMIPRTPDPELRRRAQVTANRAWSILRACLNLAFITGKAPSCDPWLRVKPFRNVDRPRQRFLTFPECKRLLNACDPDFRQIARGALFTGLRLGELLELRAIDYRGKYIHIEHSKSGKARDVPLSAQGREFFEQLTAALRHADARYGAPAGRPLRDRPVNKQKPVRQMLDGMQPASLKARIANLEDGLTERKQGIQSNDEIRKAVVSFANSVPEGRTAVLFIGVANDGAVVGLTVEEAEKVQQRVRRVCEEDCYPAIAIRLAESIEIDGKYVVGFEFGPSPNRPHFAGHAFVRVGSESIKASASKLDELIASKNTKAGRLLAAKEKYEHLTLILPAGARIAAGHPLARRRDLECIVQHCEAQHAVFYDIADRSTLSLPLDWLSFSWDTARNRLLLEYTRPGDRA
jgi:integrase